MFIKVNLKTTFLLAKNACHDYYQKNGEASEDIDLLEIPDSANNFTRFDQTDVIIKAIGSLPDFQKDVIILRFYHDIKLKEIAEITDSSLATTKSRLKQGLDKLKKILNKEDVF